MPARYPFPRVNRRHGNNIHVVLILFRLLDRILSETHQPPLTICFLVFLSALHLLRIIPTLPPQLPPIFRYLLPYLKPRQACLQPSRILSGDYYRLLSSAFVHSSFQHLVYNSAALYMHGAALERLHGPKSFALISFGLLVFAHGLYVLMAVFSLRVGNSNRLFRSCVIGASGLAFALSTVRHGRSQRSTAKVWGVDVPTVLAPFAEIVVAAVLIPNSSFYGHLAGVLAGGCLVVLEKVYVKGLQRTMRRDMGQGRRLREPHLHTE